MLLYSGDGGGSILDVNPGLIIWTTVTFIFLLIILRIIAWKPILKSLDDRENFIKDSVERAETAKKEAEEILEENKKKLAMAEEEAQKIIAQGREYAETLKNQILEESRTEAKKMIADASVEIERKNQEAFKNLKNEVAGIAVQAAEKIIRTNLDREKQTKIVDEFINDLSKS
ncbi:MAG: ATP synthase F0 subunit B [Ignavibacteriae bacterium]|nr:MAG: ATP synthase F0 subunit B [Ignavibacteriota bacterium]